MHFNFDSSEIGGPINIRLMPFFQIASVKFVNSARIGFTNSCNEKPCEAGIGFSPTPAEP